MTTVNTMTGHYFWVAIYNDGTQLLQYEPSGNEFIMHSFNEIDQSKLDEFVIVDALDNSKRYALDFDHETMELIWFWKHYIYVSVIDGAEQKRGLQTCFGWKRNIGGKVYKTIISVLEDGTVLVGDGD